MVVIQTSEGFFGPFTRREAEAKMTTSRWRRHRHGHNADMWIPPHIEGKLPDSWAYICTLEPSLPILRAEYSLPPRTL